MLGVSILQWWYGKGWLEAVKRLKQRLSEHFAAFSVSLLLQTLFAPWKQIITPKSANDNISDKFRRLVDNLFSRSIGAVVRLLTLFASLIMAVVIVVVGLILIIVWPLLPPLSIWLLLKGLGL